MRQTFDSVRVELVHDRRLDIGEITNPQDVGEGEVNALPTLHRSIARSRMVTTAVPGIGFMARPTDLSEIADLRRMFSRKRRSCPARPFVCIADKSLDVARQPADRKHHQLRMAWTRTGRQ